MHCDRHPREPPRPLIYSTCSKDAHSVFLDILTLGHFLNEHFCTYACMYNGPRQHKIETKQGRRADFVSAKYFLQIFCFQENLNSAELSGKCQIRLLASESYDDRIFVENALQGFPKALSLSATSGSLFRPLRMWRKRIFPIIFVIGQFYFTIFASFQNHSIDNNDRREVFKKLQQLKVVSKGGAH